MTEAAKARNILSLDKEILAHATVLQALLEMFQSKHSAKSTKKKVEAAMEKEIDHIEGLQWILDKMK